MNKQQESYAAFMESVCNTFNCPEALPALKEGFRAFCEAGSTSTDSTSTVSDIPLDNNEIIQLLVNSLKSRIKGAVEIKQVEAPAEYPDRLVFEIYLDGTLLIWVWARQVYSEYEKGYVIDMSWSKFGGGASGYTITVPSNELEIDEAARQIANDVNEIIETIADSGASI